MVFKWARIKDAHSEFALALFTLPDLCFFRCIDVDGIFACTNGQGFIITNVHGTFICIDG